VKFNHFVNRAHTRTLQRRECTRHCMLVNQLPFAWNSTSTTSDCSRLPRPLPADLDAGFSGYMTIQRVGGLVRGCATCDRAERCAQLQQEGGEALLLFYPTRGLHSKYRLGVLAIRSLLRAGWELMDLIRIHWYSGLFVDLVDVSTCQTTSFISEAPSNALQYIPVTSSIHPVACFRRSLYHVKDD
jgi:hypothetical protein